MKKMIRILVVALIIIIICTYSNISRAAQSINSLKNEKDSVKDKISEAQDDLEDISAEKSETLKQVESLITKISSYNKEINEVKSNISSLEKKIKEAEAKIKDDEEEYAREDAAMRERLVAMYINGDTSYLDYMFSSANIVDFISSYHLISQVAEYDAQMLEKVQKHKEKIENSKNELEKDKKSLVSSKATLESKQSALKVAKKEKQSYADKLSEDEKKTKQKIEELQEENDKLDKEIAKAQAAIEAARRAAANKTNSSKPNMNASASGFIYPIGSQYKNPTTGWYYRSGGFHGGVDFSGAGISGSPIYAVADGYVVISKAVKNKKGQYVSYGNYVLIAHYNGLYTLYAHMSSRAVSAGQTVSQGQTIGYVGSTGNSTGPHLHFEVRTGNGSYANRVYPMNYLP